MFLKIYNVFKNNRTASNYENCDFKNVNNIMEMEN